MAQKQVMENPSSDVITSSASLRSWTEFTFFRVPLATLVPLLHLLGLRSAVRSFMWIYLLWIEKYGHNTSSFEAF